MGSDPEFAELYDKLQNNAFSDHAKQLGLVCIFWSHLEANVDVFLASLLACRDRVSAGIVVNTIDMRDKLTALKACAFHSRISDAWFDELEKCVNLVDQDLRTERNRYIHDVFWPLEEGMIKHQRMAKVAKVQARVRALKLFGQEPVPAAKLTALAVRIITEAQRLSDLHEAFDAAQTP